MVLLTMEEAEKAKTLQEFSKIESNAEKVELVETKIEEMDELLSWTESSKNNDKAEQLRLQGNDYFKSKLLLKAMEMYNQSICFAEANSEALGIGYANRSMIYFLWKKYELCLNNIELATTNGCPQRLMDKLNKRKNDCKAAAAKQNHMMDDDDKYGILKPTLSFRPHPVVPFIADCLELRENSEFGRHIVTNVDLCAGQVVAIEESFCELLLPHFKYQRCTNCLRENDFNLFPCKKCTCAMFCSERCALEADQSFHRIECPIIELLSVHFAKETFIHKAIRATLRAIGSFDDMATLRSSICKVENTTVFDLNHRKDMPQSERYEAIHGLQTNQDKRTQSELYTCAEFSAVLYKILMKKTSLVDTIITDADKKVLKELLFLHVQIFPIATIRFEELSGFLPNRPSKECSSYGEGLFAFHGLLNHSCEPNCVTVCFNRQSTLFVKRPIKTGEQLFISYGYVIIFSNSFSVFKEID